MQTLREIREEMKYSMSEMAQELLLKKATYQGYEEGKRAIPPHTLEMAFQALQRDRDWSKRYIPGGELDIYFQDVPHFQGDA